VWETVLRRVLIAKLFAIGPPHTSLDRRGLWRDNALLSKEAAVVTSPSPLLVIVADRLLQPSGGSASVCKLGRNFAAAKGVVMKRFIEFKVVLRVLLILAAGALGHAQNPKIVTTVAGGYLGDHRLATAASLAHPTSVAIDANNNLYVSDEDHCEVRKISASGVITRFAGIEICGYSGDGGPAAVAMLAAPFGIAFDGQGNLLIADQGNNRIRKVTPAGVITTVAGNGTFGYSGNGGPATLAMLGAPEGVFADTSGTIYIADSANLVIRSVDALGVIQAVAGNHLPGSGGAGDGGPATSAPLGFPTSVVGDGTGAFYFAEESGRVRKVDSTGTITTYAGNGPVTHQGNQGNGDGGPATSASTGVPFGLLLSGSELYLTTDTNVWAVDTATQIIHIIAGNGVEGFNGDGSDKLSTSFSQLFGLTFNAGGDLIVADANNGRVRKISSSTQMVTTIGGGYVGDGGLGPAAALNLNTGAHIAFDAVGNLYIPDTDNNRIRKVSLSGTISTFAGTGLSAYSGDGGPASLATLSHPTAVAADAFGNIFIADAGNGVVRKIDNTGTISTLARPGFGLQPILPGIAVDSSGNVYASDGLFGIWKITPSGSSTLVAGVQFGIGFNGDGIPATQAELNLPGGVAIDSAGNLYIADWLNNRIRKVDTGGIISTVAGNGVPGFSGDGTAATAAMLSGPTDVTLDGNGNLYIADWFNARVRLVDPAGTIHTLAGTGIQNYNGNRLPASSTNLGPVGVAVSPEGVLHFSDIGSFRVRKLARP
jgi:trimeric autotransporter adhesin